MKYIKKVDVRRLYSDGTNKNKSKLYRDKVWLKNRYMNEGRSATAIAEELDVSHHTILNWLERFEIPRRSRGEATHLATCNHLLIDESLQEILDGAMLGDGCVTIKRGGFSAVYTQSGKHKEHLQWIKWLFANNSLLSYPCSSATKVMDGKTYSYWVFSSKTYAELVNFHQRWYPYGHKRLPSDLSLTPKMLLIWYIDDGCLHKPKDSRPNISLAAMDFTYNERKRLTLQLQGMGIAARNRPSGSIGILARSARGFLDMIGGCPVEPYRYKWDL